MAVGIKHFWLCSFAQKIARLLYFSHRRRAYTRGTTSFYPLLTKQTSWGPLFPAMNPVRYNRRNLSQPYPDGFPRYSLLRLTAVSYCHRARCAARKPSSPFLRSIPLSGQPAAPSGQQDDRNALCKALITRTLFVTAFSFLFVKVQSNTEK